MMERALHEANNKMQDLEGMRMLEATRRATMETALRIELEKTLRKIG
jgi:hypothetical protein